MKNRYQFRDYCARLRLVAMSGIALLLAGCVQQAVRDYSAFRAADPRSILIVPVINNTVEVSAPDYFLSTISKPVAERGFYVFPVHLVKRVSEDEGMSDSNLVHAADPTLLAKYFGADAVLYVTIERWDARYAVFSTSVTVEFSYLMKDGKTGAELWSEKQTYVYTPQNSNSGNAMADLIASAINAAATKAAPSYVPLAQAANQTAVTAKHRGLPAGPFHKNYKQDTKDF